MTAFQPGSPAYEALIAEIEGLREEAAILRTTEAAEIERLREQVASLQASSGYEASIAQVENERLRNNYFILKQDYDALRAANEHLRTTLGYLADNIDNPALVAVAEAALVERRALVPKTVPKQAQP